MNKILEVWKKYSSPLSIQVGIAISFTLAALFAMSVFGVTMYDVFVNRMETMMSENSVQLLDQTAANLENYLKSMRRISDTMYYSVIKDKDLSTDSMAQEMNLLYEANKDSLISIACYTNDGELVEAAPVAAQKPDVDVTDQAWFAEAVDLMENFHFSTPHVQNLFDDTSYRYYWVVSLSRAVELTTDGTSKLGVLLVDMNYSSIEQLLEKANTGNASEYVYLMDGDGEIIYHPKQKLIYAGLYEENNVEASSWDDGSHREDFRGESRQITVKTVSYTGWKIVRVVPISSFNMGMYETRLFFVLLLALFMLIIVVMNQMISSRIAKPLEKLNDSVKEWEAGNMTPDIYIGGFTEVEHLGRTLKSTVEQIRRLMDDVLKEQEEKRKSELDALQSQINPHFLYNTLESITWMIEGERYDDAVFMVSQLGSLFRISLSKGRTIIPVEDEIRHAKNYMNIQKIRYKNRFRAEFDVDEEILHCCTVKLIVQPLLENAIYYGVEGMDDEGEICVSGYREGDDVCIEVRDNGLGMSKETVESLLREDRARKRPASRGSGVGLINVHKRIRIRFGARYGLEVESEPDEGTVVRIRLPYLEYSPEIREYLDGRRTGQMEGGSADETK
ncbi:MAG: histidine kinase [Eubacteriales bacterium]|nr:histidine kinase [Eubacteriales bacterium]